VARPEGHRDPFYLAEAIATYQISVLHFVPSMLRHFLSIEASEQCRSVRQIICSGEALPIEIADLCRQQLGARLDNLYGPTEAAIDVTYWPCQLSERNRRMLIGWPIANIKVYLLNAHMRQVPIG